ncbi:MULTISPECIES: Abi family protein [Bacillaceae]|uniref:Abi family protein n=1 Tax=Oceanobacillus caeni TaxID=405946 RepID=A0ABR5MFW4_9BACI|nr:MULTISPECIES: Abi family protein [Bacillaceae]KKE77888.1 Abi family protein [Bacilli bacterium VT-13-104]PZD85603.1 Abi family protein [Bacilli bacterium]KPH71271.1 Abi family protein [Oceanobacillus caeni]MED4474545.1 Abi family protein [Oceanobacillus caeni]PZD87218.1 Abi family protein [Bacilli bacterium]
MKPFQTHRQQISILRARGLTINNGSTAMRIFERENYYNVINGYKDLFLVKNKNGQVVSPETYIQNTTLEEIYSLFTFDRELRNLYLKYLLIFENSMKSKISYRFSEKFKEPHAYLLFKNYSNSNLNQVLNLIAIISNKIKQRSSEKNNNSIKHYLTVHGNVPLWVLVNDLTLGNISNFYQAIDDSLKDKIAKDFSLQYKREYGATYQIPKESIVDVLKIANLIRNLCAHEERLYNFKLHHQTRARHNSQLLSIPVNLLDGRLFTMLALLKLVLPKKEHKELKVSLEELFNSYQNKFSTIPFADILAIMGFDLNWRDYL